MGLRTELQALLESILGSRNVYFQPPPNISLNYPCIIYNRETFDDKNADNIDYLTRVKYQITVIDRNPESEIPLLVKKLPLCSHNQFFTKDGLNHDIFTIYF